MQEEVGGRGTLAEGWVRELVLAGMGRVGGLSGGFRRSVKALFRRY
jgi:hypothetical protein